MNTSYITRVTAVVLGCLCLSSCSDEDYLGGHFTADGAGTPLTVTASINAATTPDLNWTEGDQISVTTGYADATSLNRIYVCGSDGKTFTKQGGYDIYVKGNTNIVAFYPYVGSEKAEPNISISTINQNSIVDYLVATAEVSPESPAANLVFDHLMSQLQITITDIPQGESITSYRLAGFDQNASLGTYDLALSLSGVPTSLTGTGTDINEIVLTLLPQNIASDAAVPASLSLIGNVRSYKIDFGDINLQSGQVSSWRCSLTNGVGTLEFVPGGSAWDNSGKGGNVTSE